MMSHSGNPKESSKFSRRLAERRAPGLLAVWLSLVWLSAWAGPIVVPNGSFESPATSSVDVRIDHWQKTDQPVWWDPNAYGPWDQLVGSFINLEPGTAQHIVNMDGSQAIWVFANPGAGLFQDYAATDWAGTTGAFTAAYEVGNAYDLKVGMLVGTAFPMEPGSVLEVSLYYRQPSSERVTIASTMVTNRPGTFNEYGTNLMDFSVHLPTVKVSDPWQGQHIGIAFISVLVPPPGGGYWDLDNVRLTARRSPMMTTPTIKDNAFTFLVEGEPGSRFEVLAGVDPARPIAEWTVMGPWTNQTGSERIVDPVGSQPRFYQVREF